MVPERACAGHGLNSRPLGESSLEGGGFESHKIDIGGRRGHRLTYLAHSFEVKRDCLAHVTFGLFKCGSGGDAAQWAPAQRFLEWARRGLSENDDYGFSNAIGYAKKSVARRIDGILRTYHLQALSRVNYPLKIKALNELGVSVPQIVSELVIDPRNELEHKYSMPTHRAAGRAIEIAELFLSATDAESSRSSIVAVNWNILGAPRIVHQ